MTTRVREATGVRDRHTQNDSGRKQRGQVGRIGWLPVARRAGDQGPSEREDPVPGWAQGGKGPEIEARPGSRTVSDGESASNLPRCTLLARRGPSATQNLRRRTLREAFEELVPTEVAPPKALRGAP